MTVYYYEDYVLGQEVEVTYPSWKGRGKVVDLDRSTASIRMSDGEMRGSVGGFSYTDFRPIPAPKLESASEDAIRAAATHLGADPSLVIAVLEFAQVLDRFKGNDTPK